MIFRLYHETRGAHVHCRLFAGPREGALGKCGDLVMRDAEFHAFVDRFPGMEFRPESSRVERRPRPEPEEEPVVYDEGNLDEYQDP